jgi:Tfp pilus assembly protein PilF
VKILSALVVSLVLAVCPACQQGGAESDPSASGQKDPVAAGMQAFKEGRLDKAIEHYQRAVKEKPRSAVVHNLLGMAYRFQYNKKPSPELKNKEIAAFEKAIEIDPKFAVALVNLGSTHYYMGDKDKAAVHFKKTLEVMPKHPQAAELKKMIAEAEEPEADEKKPEAAEKKPESEEKPEAKADPKEKTK